MLFFRPRTSFRADIYFSLFQKSLNYLTLYDANYQKIMEILKSIAEASKETIEYLKKDMVAAVKEAVG